MSLSMVHDPRCSRRRAARELLHEGGLEPDLVGYPDVPPEAVLEVLTEH